MISIQLGKVGNNPRLVKLIQGFVANCIAQSHYLIALSTVLKKYVILIYQKIILSILTQF